MRARRRRTTESPPVPFFGGPAVPKGGGAQCQEAAPYAKNSAGNETGAGCETQARSATWATLPASALLDDHDQSVSWMPLGDGLMFHPTAVVRQPGCLLCTAAAALCLAVLPHSNVRSQTTQKDADGGRQGQERAPEDS